MSKENSDDYLCFDFASNALNQPCNYSSCISVEKKKTKEAQDQHCYILIAGNIEAVLMLLFREDQAYHARL